MSEEILSTVTIIDGVVSHIEVFEIFGKFWFLGLIYKLKMAAKSSSTTILFKKRGPKKLGRNAKSKTYNKGSKNYTKKYRGQGR